MTGQAGFRGEMAKAKRDGHPDHDFSAVTQRGLKAVALGQTHLAAREPRLPAGMLDGLTADWQKLGVDVPGALVIRSSARTATKSRYEAPARGGLVVMAIRTSVLRRGAAADVRLGYGVGRGAGGGRRGGAEVGVGSGAARAGYWEYASGLYAGIEESGRSVVTGIMESGRVGELDCDVRRAARSAVFCQVEKWPVQANSLSQQTSCAGDGAVAPAPVRVDFRRARVYAGHVPWPYNEGCQ